MERLYDQFKLFLERNEEYQITLPDKNSIQFDRGDLHFYYIFDPTDPMYFHLLLPGVETITEQNRGDISNAALNITASYKVGKVVFINNSVWLSAELFLDKSSNCTVFFDRTIRLLSDMYDAYKNMRYGEK